MSLDVFRHADRTLLRNLTGGHTSRIWSVAISPDGTRIASGSIDKTVVLWNAATGVKLHALTGHTHIVLSVAFSPDGLAVASGSNDSTIRI